MKAKSNGCYSINRAELLDLLRAGGVIWWGNLGPLIYDKSRRHGAQEMHPQRRTVRSLLRDKVIVESSDANTVQRECGFSTYRLASTETTP